jgi:hypothetical protein
MKKEPTHKPETAVATINPAAIAFRCSQLGRLEACPGSGTAAKGFKDTTSKAAESGNATHKGLTTLCTAANLALPLPQFNTMAEALADEMDLDGRGAFVLPWFARIVHEVCTKGGGVKRVIPCVEDALDFSIDCGCPVSLSGCPDLQIETNDNTLHVFEFKTGALMTETSDNHAQGQGYVLLVATGQNVLAVRLHVLAAGNARGEQHTFTDYNADSIDQLQAKIASILRGGTMEGAPRNVGIEQCRYCPAAGTFRCPESVAAVDKMGHNLCKMTDAVAVFMALDPPERTAVLDRARLVSKIIDKILAAAKEAVTQDAKAIPGYFIGTGGKTVTLPDALTVFSVLQEKAGMTQADFIPALSATIGKVCDAFHDFRVKQAVAAGEKPPTGKADSEACRKLLAGVAVEGVKAGSLERE